MILLLIGCGDEPAAKLSELDGREVFLRIHGGDEDSGVNLLFDSMDYQCLDVDPPPATLGGHPLVYTVQGLASDPTRCIPGLPCEIDCYLAFHTMGPVVPQDGLVRFRDESLEVTATFDRGALEQRTASHPTWDFQPGRMESIVWSHPEDFDGGGAVVFSTGMFNPTYAVDLVPPNLITFTLPVGFPTGTFPVSVIVQSPDDDALECVNAVSCKVDQHGEYVHTGTVIPSP